jgi:superfamily I DNA/RNA helicase
VAVIDEAQDNTPQQWRAVHAMFGGVQRLHVAGDDDQAIFSWAGADMTRLLEIEGTRRVLAKSWRVPAAVYTLSAAIVSQIRTRVPKQWAPTDGEGAVLVSTIDSWHPRNVDAGSWLCLARNRRNLAEVTTRLEDLGVPYIVDGQSILDRRGVQAVLSYERLRRGESIGAEGFRKLKRHMAVSLSRDEIDDGQVSWGDITWPFAADPAARPIWLELVERRILQAPERDVMILRNIRRSGESLVANPRVVVSTIHSAKGAEADNVLLLSDTSRRTAYAARENPDDEHRVFYVGTTRAKKNLVIVPPSSKHHYSLLQ